MNTLVMISRCLQQGLPRATLARREVLASFASKTQPKLKCNVQSLVHQVPVTQTFSKSIQNMLCSRCV